MKREDCTLETVKQQLEQKATDLGDELRDNLALDSIAKAEIIKSLLQFQNDVLAVLDGLEKTLRELWKTRPNKRSFEDWHEVAEYHQKLDEWFVKAEEKVLGEPKKEPKP